MALIEIGYDPPVFAAGVPLNVPLLLRPTPFGSAPVSVKVGEPVAVTVNDPNVPTVNVVLLPLVNVGTVLTVRVKG